LQVPWFASSREFGSLEVPEVWKFPGKLLSFSPRRNPAFGGFAFGVVPPTSVAVIGGPSGFSFVVYSDRSATILPCTTPPVGPYTQDRHEYDDCSGAYAIRPNIRIRNIPWRYATVEQSKDYLVKRNEYD
jgi:hypothetical protein